MRLRKSQEQYSNSPNVREDDHKCICVIKKEKFMSEGLQEPNVHAADVKGSTDSTVQELSKEDISKLVEQVGILKRSVEKHVDDNRLIKSKYADLRDNVEKENESKLTEKENWKELLDIEKTKRIDLESSNKQIKTQALRKELNFQVAKHAGDAFDVDDVISALPRDIISIDNDNLEVANVAEAVSLLKQKKPWLFDTRKSTGQIPNRPVGEGAIEPTKEDVLLAAIKQITL